MSSMWRPHQSADSRQNLFPDAARGKRIVFGDIFPNVDNVVFSQRVEFEPGWLAHLGKCCLSSSSSRFRRESKNASPSLSLTLPLLISS